jgi:hypothetical protein
MATETEAQNTTAKVYDFTMLLSATVTASNSTGTVYPFTHIFGGGSGVGEL